MNQRVVDVQFPKFRYHHPLVLPSDHYRQKHYSALETKKVSNEQSEEKSRTARFTYFVHRNDYCKQYFLSFTMKIHKCLLDGWTCQPHNLLKGIAHYPLCVAWYKFPIQTSTNYACCSVCRSTAREFCFLLLDSLNSGIFSSLSIQGFRFDWPWTLFISFTWKCHSRVITVCCVLNVFLGVYRLLWRSGCAAYCTKHSRYYMHSKSASRTWTRIFINPWHLLRCSSQEPRECQDQGIFQCSFSRALQGTNNRWRANSAYMMCVFYSLV